MRESVQDAGFEALVMGAGPSAVPKRLPLRPVDRAREERDLRERFARRAARLRVPMVLGLCATWSPDLLVCDETDFGAMLGAERLGLPFATITVIASGSFVRPEVVAGALDDVRREHGLPPDPELAMPSRYLVLSTVPPSYRAPEHPLPATAYAFRSEVGGGGPAPDWASVRPGSPTVYVTLGTIFNLESGDLLARIVRGLRELPVQLCVTVGPDLDLGELGLQPAHVHVAHFLPQADVLPHCDLVVCHGGSGSVIAALAHGLPSVLVPLGADQPWNADRCVELGVARVLEAETLQPEGVRAAAGAVLGDPAYREQAERLRDEIAALPPLAESVALLERLAGERRPLVRGKMG